MLAPWEKSNDKLKQHIKKQRHYFANKDPYSQSCGFSSSLVMCGFESWTVKKAEPERIDAFELWCWRRLLRVPWTARRSNQSILKEISPGYSLEGLMLKLQYFSHLMWSWLIGKVTDAGKDWRQEEKGTTEDDMVGLHHQCPEFTQTHVCWVSDAIQPSHPLSSPLFLPSVFLNIRIFSNESVLCIRWPKCWRFSFSFSISLSNEYPGLISFRMDWLGLLAVQGTLKSLLQHHSSKTSVLQLSAFFIVQLSHPYMITGKTIALTRQIFVGKIMSLFFNMLSRLVITFLPSSKHLLVWETIRLNKISGFVEMENSLISAAKYCSFAPQRHLPSSLRVTLTSSSALLTCLLGFLVSPAELCGAWGSQKAKNIFQTGKNWDASKFKPMYNASSNIPVWVMNGEVMKK